jgi:hypothetical protein
MQRHLILATCCAILLMAGCTKPPYRAPDKSLAQLNGDYTDCYSQASLTANTPPYPDNAFRTVTDQTDQCMKARGYVSSCPF